MRCRYVIVIQRGLFNEIIYENSLKLAIFSNCFHTYFHELKKFYAIYSTVINTTGFIRDRKYSRPWTTRIKLRLRKFLSQVFFIQNLNLQAIGLQTGYTNSLLQIEEWAEGSRWCASGIDQNYTRRETLEPKYGIRRGTARVATHYANLYDMLSLSITQAVVVSTKRKEHLF